MIRAALLSIFAATACHAGDSTATGPLELLTPFVIETADLGPMPRRFTDAQLFAFLDEDAPLPLPLPVPLPAGLWLLAGALLALRVVRHG